MSARIAVGERQQQQQKRISRVGSDGRKQQVAATAGNGSGGGSSIVCRSFVISELVVSGESRELLVSFQRVVLAEAFLGLLLQATGGGGRFVEVRWDFGAFCGWETQVSKLIECVCV